MDKVDDQVLATLASVDRTSGGLLSVLIAERTMATGFQLPCIQMRHRSSRPSRRRWTRSCTTHASTCTDDKPVPWCCVASRCARHVIDRNL